MKPHKHAELIKAWADGAIIESRIKGLNGWSYWTLDEYPCWRPDNEYRIKPEPKPDVVMYQSVGKAIERATNWYAWTSCCYSDLPTELDQANMKLIFDGETGELKSAEVLK